MQQKLYLIVHGTVASYTENGDEVSHLRDGNMFGENKFLQYSKNLVSVR
jgi:signal-transduction protein with cAMP-binding, CBS, and nucleotidyltransferase domain